MVSTGSRVETPGVLTPGFLRHEDSQTREPKRRVSRYVERPSELGSNEDTPMNKRGNILRSKGFATKRPLPVVLGASTVARALFFLGPFVLNPYPGKVQFGPKSHHGKVRFEPKPYSGKVRFSLKSYFPRVRLDTVVRFQSTIWDEIVLRRRTP